MLIMYSFMMYMGWELGKKGYKKGRTIALAGAELLNNIYEIITGKVLYEMITSNPGIQLLGDFVYTIETLMHYIGVREEPYPLEFKHTLNEIYVALFATLGWTGKKEEKKKSNIPVPRTPKAPKVPRPKVPKR